MNATVTHTTVLHRPPLHMIQRPDLVLVMDPDWPNWIATDRRGAWILDRLDGSLTFQDVVTAYCRKFGVDQAKGWLHCSAFLNEARRAEIVAIQPEVFRRRPYPGRANVLRPTRLRELWLHVTNACNLACAHCLVESSPQGVRGLPTDQWRRVIGEAVDLGADQFYMTGGEPFLREDIFDLIQTVIHQAGLVVLTNAMLLEGDRLARLARIGLEWRERFRLQISLDGPRADVNDPIRGKGVFEATVRGIRNVVHAGFEPTVTTVVTEATTQHLPDMTRLLADLGVRHQHLLWAIPRGRALRSGNGLSAPPVERCIATVQRALEVAREVGVTIDNVESVRLRLMGRRGVKADLSNAGYDSLCVYADGRVFPSAASAGHPALEMGSVLEQPLRAIWQVSEFGEVGKVGRAVREATVQQKAHCAESPFRFLTGGGDLDQGYFASTAAGHEDFLSDDPLCPLNEWIVVEQMAAIAQERRRLRTPSGYDCPPIYYAMGEGTIPTEHISLSPQGRGGGEGADFEVNTLHSTCVLLVDLDYSRSMVREFYARAATAPQAVLCCAGGYAEDETAHIPAEVLAVAYGCGSPVGAGRIQPGEVVVDLGSGGGIDCFVAAKAVGPAGRVIGVDMTDEMLGRARAAAPIVARQLGYDVVEFRKGFLEEIPVPDRSADVVLSNCVINLSPDKRRVFREVWRMLNDHGRFVLSDTVAGRPVPATMRANPRLWGECVSGALTLEEYLAMLEQTGFYGLSVLSQAVWKEVEGIPFFSVILRGYKFEKRAGCAYIGQRAVYLGPLKAVMDEEGHLFPRNEAIVVCTDTAAKLSRAPYASQFAIVGGEADAAAADGLVPAPVEAAQAGVAGVCCPPGTCG